MPNILSRAELLLQAKNYSGTGAWLDESGNSHDAQLGSTAGVDANDPEFLAHSGDNYVRLPGSSGNYVSSADVNLLGADTAHLHQSLGVFTHVLNGTGLAQSTALSPVFGDYHMAFDADGGGVAYAYINNTADRIPVSVSTDYSGAAYASTDTAGVRARVAIRIYTSASSGYTYGDYVDLVPGVWSLLTVDGASSADAVTARIEVQFDKQGGGACDLGTKCYSDAYCIEQSSTSQGFVPSLRIVGDVELESKLAIATTQPTGTAGIFCYSNSSVTARHDFTFYNDAGTLYMFTYNSTGNGSREVSLDGEVHTYKWQQIVSGADRIARFYVDGVQAGSDSTIAGSATLANTPPSYGVGGRTIDGASNLDGTIYWAEVRDGIGGPVVARYDADDAAEPFATQTGAVDGRSWTYNRSGSGLYVVDRPAFGYHTDDYHLVANDAGLNFDGTEDFSIVAVGRVRDASPAAHEAFVGKMATVPSTGYALYSNTTAGLVEALTAGVSTQVDTASGISDRTAVVVAMVKDCTADTLEAFVDGAGSGSPATADSVESSTNSLTIGALSAPANFFDGEIMAVALFREALTDDEIALVGKSLAGLAPGSGEYVDQDALGAIRNRLLFEGTYTEATAPRGIVGALNAFLGTTSGDVEGALNEKIGSGYVGVVQACNTLLAGTATVYEENDGLRKLAELYVP